MLKIRVVWLVLLCCGLILGGCGDDSGGDSGPVADMGGDVGPEDQGLDGEDASEDMADTADAAAGDATVDDDVTEEPLGPLEASMYCESVVDAFCPYYLRCGRMAVDDLDACREAFLESCNNIYEPRYVAMAEKGWIELSREGIDACAEHLEDVACEAQVFDLDLGCAGVWRGLRSEGEGCGLGLESFVCGEGSACRIGLDFCGSCVAFAAPGEACGEEGGYCGQTGACVDGVCVARKLPGESCAGGEACVVGARCEEGVCRANAIVGVGEACDQVNRCPYKAECIQGRCVESALVGERCGGQRACASGVCQDGVCAKPDFGNNLTSECLP